MLVEIDRKSGFCFGVQNAVTIAEEALCKGEPVFSLGAIVHNDREVERLSSLGLVTIDHTRFRELKDCKVLIRAHGEPPETYTVAAKNNIEIIEATCPIVKKLQSRIAGIWDKVLKTNGQLVIFGKQGHAEVKGLMGQIGDKGTLLQKPADAEKIDISRPVYLFAQTTMSIEAYVRLSEIIKQRMEKMGVDPSTHLFVHRTTCGQVSNREPHLRLFAQQHDIIIFVSGKESSNGKMLYSVCKNVNHDTWFISSPDEINETWFHGKKSAGICGATSTPKWLIEDIARRIADMNA